MGQKKQYQKTTQQWLNQQQRNQMDLSWNWFKLINLLKLQGSFSETNNQWLQIKTTSILLMGKKQHQKTRVNGFFALSGQTNSCVWKENILQIFFQEWWTKMNIVD